MGKYELLYINENTQNSRVPCKHIQCMTCNRCVKLFCFKLLNRENVENRLPIQTCELVNADWTGVIDHIGHLNGDKNLTLIRFNRGAKGIGVCLRIYAMCFTLRVGCGGNWLKCTSQIISATAQASRVLLGAFTKPRKIAGCHY